VLEVHCEAGVVDCEALAAEQTLEGRCALIALVVRDFVVAAAAGSFLADVNLFLDLFVECIEGDRR
jgi:hypothetical protein